MSLTSSLLTAVQSAFTPRRSARHAVREDKQKPNTREVREVDDECWVNPGRSTPPCTTNPAAAAATVRSSRKRARPEDDNVDIARAPRCLSFTTRSTSFSSFSPCANSSQSLSAAPARRRPLVRRARSNAVVAQPLSDVEMREILQARMGNQYDFGDGAAPLQVDQTWHDWLRHETSPFINLVLTLTFHSVCFSLCVRTVSR
jgi:hypothetical protein